MPIALSRKPRGHPSRWAKSLSRAPIDAVPATDVGTNAKRRLRLVDAGLDRQYRRQLNPNPQPSRDARLRQNLKGRGVLARLPAVGVQIQPVHAQSFEADVAGQTFTFMANLGEEFAGRIIVVAIGNYFNTGSSSGNYENVTLDGIACTEEAVEHFGSLYSILLPSKTNAVLSFNTDAGLDTTGSLQVQIFNVRDAVLPSTFAEAEDTNGAHTTSPIPVMPYGAVLAVNVGPSYFEPAGVIWSANVDLDIISADRFTFREIDLHQNMGAAWKQVQQSTDITITVEGASAGGGNDNTGILAIALGPPHISVEPTFYDLNLNNTIGAGVDAILGLAIDGPDTADGNDYVFSDIELGGIAGRLLIFFTYGQFFLGDQGQTLVGATYNGVALTELSNIVSVGGYSLGATYYVIDPGFSSPGEFRLTFGLDPQAFGFPQAFLSVFDVSGQHASTPILDSADVFDATSDGSESLTLNVEENGAVVALAFGAAYSDGGAETNTQTWTGISNSTVFGFNVVLDIGSVFIGADDAAYLIESDDDDDISIQTGPEKMIMAVSIKPAPPPVFDVEFAELATPISYSFSLTDVATGGSIPVTPYLYTYAFVGVADPAGNLVVPANWEYDFVGMIELGAFSITPAAYTYTLINTGIPPGIWFEDTGLPKTWTEQDIESQGWTEQISAGSNWTEE